MNVDEQDGEYIWEMNEYGLQTVVKRPSADKTKSSGAAAADLNPCNVATSEIKRTTEIEHGIPKTSKDNEKEQPAIALEVDDESVAAAHVGVNQTVNIEEKKEDAEEKNGDKEEKKDNEEEEKKEDEEEKKDDTFPLEIDSEGYSENDYEDLSGLDCITRCKFYNDNGCNSRYEGDIYPKDYVDVDDLILRNERAQLKAKITQPPLSEKDKNASWWAEVSLNRFQI